MQDVDYVVWITRWMHIVAAITAVGGAVFMRLALRGGASEALDDAARQRLHQAVVRRWKPILHACIAILIATGGFNFYRLAISTGLKPMPYHAIFGVKIILALFVFFIGVALMGGSPGTAAIRGRAPTWLARLIGAAVVIVLLSGLLAQVRITSAP